MKSVLAFSVSFLVTYLSVPLFILLALRLNILDFPGARKVHRIATPLLGGAAIYLGLITGLLFFNLKYFHLYFPILIGGSLILLLGLITDIKEPSASLRFFCQTLIALVVIKLGARISFLPKGAWGDIIEVLVTVVWIVGVTNAYNYLDGLDGLAGGSAAINLCSFAVILYLTGQYPLGLLSIILLAACLGFLPFNFTKAKIFLGEAGSTFLGFTLAGIALVGNWAEDSIVKISIPVLILGVPIFDMIFTTIMRIREGKIKTVAEWLHYGGRDHFHHYLVDLGFRPLGAAVFIFGVTLSLGISAIMVSNDRATEAFLAILQSGIIFVIVANLIVVGKRRRSGWR